MTKLQEEIMKEVAGLEDLDDIISIVIDRTIELMEGCIGEEESSVSPETGMKEYLPYNKGFTAGSNERRDLFLSNIKALKV